MDGEADEDFLDGGAGDDQRAGGSGQDMLMGGAGADSLIFNALTDSTAAAAAADRIEDFATGDLVDVSRIDANTAQTGDQAFVLVGAFTGQAGQATLTYEAVNNLTRFLADVDGDDVADIEITIAGNIEGSQGWVL